MASIEEFHSEASSTAGDSSTTSGISSNEDDIQKVEDTENESEVCSYTLDLSNENFVEKMADLKTEKSKVLLDLQSVKELCNSFTTLTLQNDKLTKSVSALESQQTAFRQTISNLTYQRDEFSKQYHKTETDRTALLSNVGILTQKVDILYECIETEKKKFAEKVQELNLCEIRLTEQERKIEQFRTSSSTLNSILGRQRTSGNTAGLGYNETPPPFNHNYSFLKSECDVKANSVDSSCESSSTRDDQTESSTSTESSVSETTMSTLAENSKPKQPMDDLKCFKCREHGHVASVCPQKKRKQANRSPSPKKEQAGRSSSPKTKQMAHSHSPVRKQVQHARHSMARSYSPVRKQVPQKWIRKQEHTGVSNDRAFQPRPFRPSFRSSNPYCPSQREPSFYQQSRSFRPPRNHLNSNVNATVTKDDGFLKEFVYVNEYGESRRVMAWVPNHN